MIFLVEYDMMFLVGCDMIFLIGCHTIFLIKCRTIFLIGWDLIFLIRCDSWYLVLGIIILVWCDIVFAMRFVCLFFKTLRRDWRRGLIDCRFDMMWCYILDMMFVKWSDVIFCNVEALRRCICFHFFSRRLVVIGVEDWWIADLVGCEKIFAMQRASWHCAFWLFFRTFSRSYKPQHGINKEAFVSSFLSWEVGVANDKF